MQQNRIVKYNHEQGQGRGKVIVRTRDHREFMVEMHIVIGRLSWLWNHHHVIIILSVTVLILTGLNIIILWRYRHCSFFLIMNSFKNKLDKFWSTQAIIYDYESPLTITNGTGNYEIKIFDSEDLIMEEPTGSCDQNRHKVR